jgi:hypothetical protein
MNTSWNVFEIIAENWSFLAQFAVNVIKVGMNVV